MLEATTKDTSPAKFNPHQQRTFRARSRQVNFSFENTKEKQKTKKGQMATPIW